MASRSYHCSTCDLTFSFKSKLERHTKSASHTFFVDSINDSMQGLPIMEDEGGHEELQQLNVPEEMEEDISGEGGGHSSSDNNEYDESPDLDIETLNYGNNFLPFPNKISALLFLLKHSPRPMGESNLKFIFFTMTQCADPGLVPSFSKIKNFDLPGMSQPIKYQTSSGIPYYVNSLTSIIQRCIGNPSLAKMIHRFPVIPNGTYREMYHAYRWHSNPKYYSPMISLCDGTHVFIRDCTSCKHPLFGEVMSIVNKFLLQDVTFEILAELDILLTLEQYQEAVPNTLACYLPYGTRIIFETITLPISDILGICTVPLSLLKWDPSSATLLQVSREDYSAYLHPHPFKEKSRGKPVVMLPLILFTDDTSGNKSKKWHKFDSWSLLLAGLPRHENSKISNIHFICCSDSVSALDMAKPIVAELTILEEEGVEAYDALLKQPVIVLAPLICILADNPRASELLNHLGGSARKYCRMCIADRDVNPTEKDVPHSLLSSLRQIEEIKRATSEREKKELRTSYGMKEEPNPMLSLNVDIFQVFPIESLHTILLGPYKYLLKCTIPTLSTEQKDQVLARIRAFNYSGFKVRLQGNVIRHHKSFVGRDYKAWAQMALFIIYPYLSDADKKVWLALSKIFRITYCAYYKPSKATEWKDLFQKFVDIVSENQPTSHVTFGGVYGAVWPYFCY